MTTEQAIATGKQYIDSFFATAKRYVIMRMTDKMNYINNLLSTDGVEQLATDIPEAFNPLYDYLTEKLKNQKVNESKSLVKKIIAESKKPL